MEYVDPRLPRRIEEWHSPALGMNMPIVTYGERGHPLLLFPTAAADFLEKWDSLLGEAATANLIAVNEGEQICIYVILRNALFRYAPGFAGIMGPTVFAPLPKNSTR